MGDDKKIAKKLSVRYAEEGKKTKKHRPHSTNFSINNEPLNTLRSRQLE